MALSICSVIANAAASLDKTGKEITPHGSALFAVACFLDPISEAPAPLHWHDDLEMFTVVSGCAKVFVGTESLLLQTGESLLINAEILHEITAHGAENCVIKCICWDPYMICGKENSIFWQKYTQPFLADKKNFCFVKMSADAEPDTVRRALFLDAWQKCVDEPAGYEIDVRYALEKILSLTLLCKPGATVRSDGSLRQEERLKKMLGFLHLHYAEDITTAQIAKSAAVSASEATRCFRLLLNSSPVNYLKNYRLEKAYLLLDGSRPVNEVAYGCGFHDMSYFAKEFKRKYALTATQKSNG